VGGIHAKGVGVNRIIKKHEIFSINNRIGLKPDPPIHSNDQVDQLAKHPEKQVEHATRAADERNISFVQETQWDLSAGLFLKAVAKSLITCRRVKEDIHMVKVKKNGIDHRF